jgi:hypothetical protein
MESSIAAFLIRQLAFELLPIHRAFSFALKIRSMNVVAVVYVGARWSHDLFKNGLNTFQPGGASFCPGGLAHVG